MASKEMKHDVRAIAAAFDIYGDFVSAKPYGSGHINDTYAATFDQGATRIRYLFQRINHNIFKNPEGLMQNVARVCAHSQQKLRESGAPDASRRSLSLVPTRDGRQWFVDKDGNTWRTYLFVERARGYDVIENTAQAYQAARSFGAFQKLLVDIPGERLIETIPNFHNTTARFAAFRAALAADKHNRAHEVKSEIDFLVKREADCNIVVDHIAAGRIPERVTHNDTKLNNVLIDDYTQEGICVIDLDTAMPGSALYDFGDMVRTSTSPSKEDETDLSKIYLQENYFEALVRGYFSTAGEFLNSYEKELLPFSGKLLTLECGMRFLTDYLDGDNYFKTTRPGHNLDRCRNQFQLVTDIEGKLEKLNKLVAGL